MNTETQEVLEITPEMRVIMGEMQLTERHLALGISKGYEARLINEDKPAVRGNVIWAHVNHIDAFQSYMDSEVLAAFEDAKKAGLQLANSVVKKEESFTRPVTASDFDGIIQEAYQKKCISKGCIAYQRREKGEKWAAMEANALNNAKRFAETYQLPWPIRTINQAQPH